MPWEAQPSPSGSWTSLDEDRVYFASYYALDDYVVDEEWTLPAGPAGTWEPVS